MAKKSKKYILILQYISIILFFRIAWAFLPEAPNENSIVTTQLYIVGTINSQSNSSFSELLNREFFSMTEVKFWLVCPQNVYLLFCSPISMLLHRRKVYWVWDCDRPGRVRTSHSAVSGKL